MSPKRAIGILLTGLLILSGSVASAKKKKQPAPEAGEAQPEGEAPVGDQPSKVLERAFKLYDGEDYYSASIELNKVVEGESGDSEPNKQKAEFWMGKALYNMKYYSASLSYFDRIVQKGPSHAYYNATLKWLASLSRQLPDSTGILEKIGKYNRAELDQPALEKVRDELYFLLGKFYYQKGQLQGGRRAVPGGPAEQRVLRRRPSCSRARRTSASTRPSRPSSPSRRSCGPRRESEDPQDPAVRGPRQPVAGAHVLLDRPVRSGREVLRPRLAGRVRLGEQPVRVVVGELHAQAEGLLEGARQHPHASRRRSSRSTSSPSRSPRG